MEDTPINNFKVKSVIHDYEVRFIDSIDNTLAMELADGDFIIIDNKIKTLYSVQLTNVLKKYNYICINATETQKSYSGIIPIIQKLIENGFRKNHRLVAIGGGITQDITAFISSIMYRGVNWIFFPTTLLAQGDSCIGSKTSINFEEFKNQVGGFYPPNKILIYPGFIDTLSEPEMKSGMGEMLHYFIVSGETDFLFYKKFYKEAFIDKSILSKIIARSLEIKKGYIEKDEFDQNIRQVFNYGHSFGHAIESLTQYRISVKMGYLPEVIRNEIREVTESIWYGYEIDDIDINLYMAALRKDKKNVGTKLGLILNKGYGQIFKSVIDADKVFIGWIEDYFFNELKN